MAALLERWVRDESMRAGLLQLCSATGIVVAPQTTSDSLKDNLKRAFQRGDLLLVRLRVLSSGGGTEEKAKREVPPPPPERETGGKTWVELRLVDMEGNPAGGKLFLIKTPVVGRTLQVRGRRPRRPSDSATRRPRAGVDARPTFTASW